MLNLIRQGHPKGLYLLFFVEMWERFSYYGMRALLILYMVQSLVISAEKASLIYGIYTGFAYFTPLIGGYIADRYIGQRKCITYGAVLMILGLFGLCINTRFIFFCSLALMIIANGFFKSNISTVVGMLYGSDNSKKDSGFTIFYMGINLGALLSPLVCGSLAVIYGYRAGFAAAGCGMILGLITYKLFEQKLLKNHGVISNFTQEGIPSYKTDKITDSDKKRIISLFVLMTFSIVFWLAYEQAGSSLTLFAEYSINRTLFGKTIPTEYFQSLNPLFIILFAPAVSSIWIWLNKRGKEPSSVSKFIFAFLIISFAYLILFFAVNTPQSGLISPIWLILYYLFATIAELCLSPIGLSLVSKLAPIKFASLLMGTWFLSSFIGNLSAGVFAGSYSLISQTDFFLILSILPAVMAIILFIIGRKLAIE